MDSSELGWRNLTLKGYEYGQQAVNIPSMRDYMIVIYNDCQARMQRRDGGPWKADQVGQGRVSILTRGESSEWSWDSEIKVSHLYLAHESLARVAGEVFDKEIVDIELSDVLQAADPILHNISSMLKMELDSGGIGGSMYVDSIRNQLCIHMLRTYAGVAFRRYNNFGKLSPHQCRLIDDFIDENISSNISLEQLADLLGLRVFSLIRKFQSTLETSPHAYVMQKRVERACKMLSNSESPLKVIAANSGFADQSHMTRVFRKMLNATPGSLRRSSMCEGGN